MVTDQQVRRLMTIRQTEASLATAAAKAGMDPKTARKYIRSGKLPSECRPERTWRTRRDPFEEVWEEVREFLEVNPGLEAKTIFEYFQRHDPGRFSDGQLRTLQRRVKEWRALEGPPKEVYFAQLHRPGELSQSDFTHLTELEITIEGRPYPHLLYHFVLTYSNWETGTICPSESFESLSEGLQNALWELGGVPVRHQTDRLSAAVQNLEETERETFTPRYTGLLRHYALEPRTIGAGKANENGDVEQSHNRFKKALDQALMLRGSRDFASVVEYRLFLRSLFDQLNAGRRERFEEETAVLRRLPERRLDTVKKIRDIRVCSGSTARIDRNTYSVPSRLIGEAIEARLRVETVEIWYAQKLIETLPRLRGEGRHSVRYQHVISWLVRKPGAFENYRYREDLFPNTRFRMVYDALKATRPSRANKEYLAILHLAFDHGESRVERAIGIALAGDEAITASAIEDLVHGEEGTGCPWREVEVDAVDLSRYDALLTCEEVA